MPGRIGMPRLDPAEVEARLRRVERRLQAGATYSTVAQDEGVKPGALRELYRRHRGAYLVLDRKCALLECGKAYQTTRPDQQYCCRQHTKRALERVRLGRTTVMRECRLPGCAVELPTSVGMVGSRQFCGEEHADRFTSRTKINYYDRLADRTACSIPGCDFWGPCLQEHHLKRRTDGGLDTPNNLRLLCPNHHGLIHAGLITYDGRRVVDHRETIRKDEMRKRRLWKDRPPTAPGKRLKKDAH